MPPIRIACVEYLNTAPLVEGLSKLESLTLVPTVPARIADLVRDGSADIGLCSIVDAVVGPEPLALLPVGMIGCDGPTHTVRIFSRVPLDRIEALHADAESHTSVALAQVLLARRHGVCPRVVEFDARRHAPGAPWPDAVLLIGDKVVTNHPPAERYPHQLDLGEAWKSLTGLPFVYAMWMCRSRRAAEPSLQHAAALLQRQRLRNLQRLDWIVDRHAPAAGWSIEVARRYVGELLRYSVGPRERDAVEQFFREAAHLGLLPSVEPVWGDALAPA